MVKGIRTEIQVGGSLRENTLPGVRHVRFADDKMGCGCGAGDRESRPGRIACATTVMVVEVGRQKEFIEAQAMMESQQVHKQRYEQMEAHREEEKMRLENKRAPHLMTRVLASRFLISM